MNTLNPTITTTAAEHAEAASKKVARLLECVAEVSALLLADLGAKQTVALETALETGERIGLEVLTNSRGAVCVALVSVGTKTMRLRTLALGKTYGNESTGVH